MGYAIVNAEHARVAARFDDRAAANAALKRCGAGYALVSDAGVPLAWSPPTDSRRAERLGRRITEAFEARAAEPPPRLAIAPPPPKTEPPQEEEETVLRETKGAAPSKSAESPRAAVATCNHPRGCTRPAARVMTTTPDAERGWCRQHRNYAQKTRKAQAERAVPAAKKKPAPAKATTKKRAAVAAVKVRETGARKTAEFPLGAADLVVRSLRVIDQLGGLERAERIAAAIGGA